MQVAGWDHCERTFKLPRRTHKKRGGGVKGTYIFANHSPRFYSSDSMVVLIDPEISIESSPGES